MLDPLFSGTSIRRAFDDQRRKALQDIAAQPPDVLLRQHLDELVAERVERWRFDPLVLNWADKKIEPSEFDRVISGRTQSGKVAGTALTLVVPFTGMPGLLRMRPSTHAKKPPGGFIWGEILLLSYVGISPDDATVQRDLDRQEAVVKERVSSINKDVGVFNAELPGLLRNALQARLDKIRDKIRVDDDLMAALEIPRATLEIPQAALGVPWRQRPRSKRAHIEANAPEPGYLLAQSRVDPYRTPGWSDLAQSFRAQTEERRQAGRGRAGRPIGSGRLIVDRAELLDRYRKLRQRAGRRPTQQDFAQANAMGVRTVRTYLRRFGLPWPPE